MDSILETVETKLSTDSVQNRFVFLVCIPHPFNEILRLDKYCQFDCCFFLAFNFNFSDRLHVKFDVDSEVCYRDGRPQVLTSIQVFWGLENIAFSSAIVA